MLLNVVEGSVCAPQLAERYIFSPCNCAAGFAVGAAHDIALAFPAHGNVCGRRRIDADDTLMHVAALGRRGVPGTITISEPPINSPPGVPAIIHAMVQWTPFFNVWSRVNREYPYPPGKFEPETEDDRRAWFAQALAKIDATVPLGERVAIPWSVAQRYIVQVDGCRTHFVVYQDIADGLDRVAFTPS